MTVMPTVQSFTYFHRCGVSGKESFIIIWKHSEPILVPWGNPEVSWGSKETEHLIKDGLLVSSEEITQPRYQVRVKSQINVLVNNKSLIYKVKCFSEIIKIESKRGITFVKVAVYEFKKIN